MNSDEEYDVKENARIAALSDPSSKFYLGMSRLLSEVDAREALAKRKKDRVVIPFRVSVETRRSMEERFGWNIDVVDSGVRLRFPEYVAALVYCMSVRNLLKRGSDAEEIVAIDEDVAMMAAKGVAYVHVCRTHATTRLQAGYAHEDSQLRKLMMSPQSSVALSAKDLRDQIVVGGGNRVCINASECRRQAEVVTFNHAKTPVSLAQAVATARAHNADVVEGEAFFQAEMLLHTEGSLDAFPGRYVIDRDRDIISYIPDQEPSMSFSHPFSALTSFFLNHEYYDRSGRWLVEKNLGRDGVFTYVIKRVGSVTFRTPETLSANYYSKDLTRVTRLEYPEYDARLLVRGRNPIRRRCVSILTDVYDRVCAKMLAADASQVTPEGVMVALRDRNNTVVVNGDTVRRPDRMAYSDEAGAAIAICAMVRQRRMEASAEMKVLLNAVKSRYQLRDAGASELLSLACGMIAKKWWIFSDKPPSVSDTVETIDQWRQELSVTVEDLSNVVTVTRVVGTTEETVDAGTCGRHLPGFRKPGFQGVIDRALAYMSRKVDRSPLEPVRPNVSIRVDMPADDDVSINSEGANSPTIDSSVETVGFPSEELKHTLSSDERFVKKVEMRAEERAVENIEMYTEMHSPKHELTQFHKELLEKLTRDQDALRIARPPREIYTYESPSRPDVVPAPVLSVPVVTAMQEDYDRIMGDVSQHDFEVAPYIAGESDFHRSIDVNMTVNDSKRDIPKSRVVRRSLLRTAGTGPRPKDQAGLIAALFKRNAGVPTTRGYVDLDTIPGAVFNNVARACFMPQWEQVLQTELDNGMWTPTVEDLSEYIPKLEMNKARRLLDEWFTLSDFNMTDWLLMVKGKAKPPVDRGAASKVALPQTIMYNESSGMNAMYSSMLTRFYHFFSRILRPEVRLNNRDSPVEHESWFNSLERKRASCRSVYRYEGDIFCYDRSQEHVGLACELALYRRMGLDVDTLKRWEQTHGVKKATSMMLGVVIFIVHQGLSGIFKTLFRNGYICLASVVTSCGLGYEDILSLDVTGDDFLLETNRRVCTQYGINSFALTFNLSTKFYSVDVAYFCSKYWVKVDGYWFWVADPVRKAESIGSALAVDSQRDILSDRWISLRDDLRHYDNGLVVDALAAAVAARMGLDFLPYGLILGLAALAASKDEFMKFYGPEERIG